MGKNYCENYVLLVGVFSGIVRLCPKMKATLLWHFSVNIQAVWGQKEHSRQDYDRWCKDRHTDHLTISGAYPLCQQDLANLLWRHCTTPVKQGCFKMDTLGKPAENTYSFPHSCSHLLRIPTVSEGSCSTSHKVLLDCQGGITHIVFGSAWNLQPSIQL